MALPGVKTTISDGALAAAVGPAAVKTALIITADKFTLDDKVYFGTNANVTGVHTFSSNPSLDLDKLEPGVLPYKTYKEAKKKYDEDPSHANAQALKTAADAIDEDGDAAKKTAVVHKAYTSAKRLKEQLDLFYNEVGGSAELTVIGVKDTVNHPDFVDQAKDAFKKMIETQGISLVGTVVSLYKTNAQNTTIPKIDHTLGGVVNIPAITKSPTLVKKTDTFGQAIPKAQQAGDAHIDNTEESLQFVLDGRSFNGDLTTLKDYRADTSQNNGRVSVMLSSVSNVKDHEESTAVGLVLGRLQKINVAENIGFVQAGEVSYTQETYLGEKKTSATATVWASVYEKGYIFLRTYPGRTGEYFVSDPTISSITTDYRNIVRQRVVDKVRSILYQTYLPSINGKLDIDASTGRLSDTAVTFMSVDGQGALQGMVDDDEIDSFSLNIPAGQDVLATSTVNIQVRVVPKGYAEEIKLNLGFTKTV